jgi:hypothetical protein
VATGTQAGVEAAGADNLGEEVREAGVTAAEVLVLDSFMKGDGGSLRKLFVEADMKTKIQTG